MGILAGIMEASANFGQMVLDGKGAKDFESRIYEVPGSGAVRIRASDFPLVMSGDFPSAMFRGVRMNAIERERDRRVTGGYFRSGPGLYDTLKSEHEGLGLLKTGGIYGKEYKNVFQGTMQDTQIQQVLQDIQVLMGGMDRVVDRWGDRSVSTIMPVATTSHGKTVANLAQVAVHNVDAAVKNLFANIVSAGKGGPAS